MCALLTCCRLSQVWFATQGEMSATVIYHPDKYSRLQREVRARLLDGHPAAWSSNIKVGRRSGSETAPNGSRQEQAPGPSHGFGV